VNRANYIAMFRALERTRTRYAECVKITRTDSTIFRFTAHDKPLTITESDGTRHEYVSAQSFSLTALETQAGLAVSNMDIEGIITDDSITEVDLANGLFTNARVDIFIAYWSNNKIGILPLRASWIGELSTAGPKWKADLRGIAGRLAQTFTKVTQLECRWQFGDSDCGLDLSALGYVHDYTIATTNGSDEFTAPIVSAQHGNYFQWGTCEFLTGSNAGATMEVYKQFETKVRLFLPMAATISAGDTVRLTRGCNKTFGRCCDFSNTRRFGGEPFLTGGDTLAKYPTYGGDDGPS